MIWIVTSAGAFALLVALFVWVRGKIHGPAKAVVERELTRVFERAAEDIKSVPDPSRPIDIKEAVHDLRQTRDRGRNPPE